MNTLNVKIKNYINEKGITQSFVAKKSGISAPKLSATLNGKRNLYADEFEAICKALNVSPTTFISLN